MLGTLSGLPGHICLTAMFSLGFSPLFKDKGRGWLGSKRTDPTWRVRVIENTDTKSHGHIWDAHYDNACFSQAVVQMWNQPWGDPSRALDIASQDRGPLLPHKGTIILGGVPLPPQPIQLFQDSKAVTACLEYPLAHRRTFCWRYSQLSSACARLSWEETH